MAKLNLAILTARSRSKLSSILSNSRLGLKDNALDNVLLPDEKFPPLPVETNALPTLAQPWIEGALSRRAYYKSALKSQRASEHLLAGPAMASNPNSILT